MSPATVTVTGTTPEPAGGVTVQLVVVGHATDVPAAVPKSMTVAPAAVAKRAPVTVTVPPPAPGPLVGEIPVTRGPHSRGTSAAAFGVPSPVAMS